MLLAGLRRSEIVRLQRGDYDEEENLLRVRTAGRNLRVVMLQGACSEYLEAWLAERGARSGELFLAIGPADDVRPAGLSPSAVNRIIALRARSVGVQGVTPRDLRARFLSLLRAGQRAPEAAVCRYYLTDDGQPAWTLPSLQSA
jgi:integrase